MLVQLSSAQISPVNVEERKALGIRSGDTVRVSQKIEDKGKVRIQVYEGLVIAHKHGTEAGATITVRATLSGIGVEKIFPLYSPQIDKIEIVRRSKVRRAKLYYIRDKVAREIRRQLRHMKLVSIGTESEKEQTERAEKEAAEAEEAAQAAATAAAAVEEEKVEEVAETVDSTSVDSTTEETPEETPTVEEEKAA